MTVSRAMYLEQQRLLAQPQQRVGRSARQQGSRVRRHLHHRQQIQLSGPVLPGTWRCSAAFDCIEESETCRIERVRLVHHVNGSPLRRTWLGKTALKWSRQERKQACRPRYTSQSAYDGCSAAQNKHSIRDAGSVQRPQRNRSLGSFRRPAPRPQFYKPPRPESQCHGGTHSSGWAA